jgi:hypothetical protein
MTSKFGKLSKLDFDTAEELLIKALQEFTAVGREEKRVECRAVYQKHE